MASPKERSGMTPREKGFAPTAAALHPVPAPAPAATIPPLDAATQKEAASLGLDAASLYWARRRYAALRKADLKLVRHMLADGAMLDHLVAAGRSAMLMAHRLNHARVRADDVEAQVAHRWIDPQDDQPDMLSPAEWAEFAPALQAWESGAGRLFATGL